MRALSLAALACAALPAVLAPAALGGHNGVPVPDGTMLVHVGFVTVVTYAPSPIGDMDGDWAALCADTHDLPTGDSAPYLPVVDMQMAVTCDYEGRVCLPNDVQQLCDLYSPVPLPTVPAL
jgi:hypothetical protein